MNVPDDNENFNDGFSDDEKEEDYDDEVLQLKSLFKRGKLNRTIGAHVKPHFAAICTVPLRARCLSCVTVVGEALLGSIWVGDLNGQLYIYDLQTKKFQTVREENSKQSIFSIASNETNSLVAVGYQDGNIAIYNAHTRKLVELLPGDFGHREAVYGLCFRKGTNELLSASADRCIKLWNIDEMAFIRTLFGHHNQVLAVSALYQERLASASIDKQPRLWKLDADTTLGFQRMESIQDSVAMFSDSMFVTVGTNGSITVFSNEKQKPMTYFPNAHGFQADLAFQNASYGSGLESAIAKQLHQKETSLSSEKTSIVDEEENSEPSIESQRKHLDRGKGISNWVHSVAAVPYSDLFATGSCDGHIRFWRYDASIKRVLAVDSIDASGFVNGICFSSDSKTLIACVGPHHRLGRWLSASGPAAKNRIIICPLLYDINISDFTNFKASIPESRFGTTLPVLDMDNLRKVKKLAKTPNYHPETTHERKKPKTH